MNFQDPPVTATADQGPAVQVEGLVIDRGGSRVLEQVTMAVSHGEVVAIQGSSGAGKTTLLATLCGLIKPTSGVVNVLGRDISSSSDKTRSVVRLRNFGLVFQGDELLPELTLAENVTLPLRLLAGRVTKADWARANSLAEELGIQAVMTRMPAAVSGGQLQRAAIARALIHSPAIVLADEPTTALDQANATSAMTSLIAVARQHHTAVVIVTHSNEVAARCDRRAVLAGGRLLGYDRLTKLGSPER